MNPTYAPRRTIIAGTVAGLMVALAVPVGAVNIPEGGAVTPDSSFVFHLRVTQGCDGLPTDALEVTIPASVTNPIPEAVAGWAVEIEAPDPEGDGDAEDETSEETEKSDEEEAPTVVRWSGGSLDDGLLLDFGIRARFPDEEGEVLEFPVIQGCGEVELEYQPTVTLSQRYGQAAIAEIDATVAQLSVDVEALRADVDQLQQQVGDVNVENLRSRVGDTEKAIAELDERVSTLEGEPGPEPTPEPEA